MSLTLLAFTLATLLVTSFAYVPAERPSSPQSEWADVLPPQSERADVLPPSPLSLDCLPHGASCTTGSECCNKRCILLNIFPWPIMKCDLTNWLAVWLIATLQIKSAQQTIKFFDEA